MPVIEYQEIRTGYISIQENPVQVTTGGGGGGDQKYNPICLLIFQVIALILTIVQFSTMDHGKELEFRVWFIILGTLIGTQTLAIIFQIMILKRPVKVWTFVSRTFLGCVVIQFLTMINYNQASNGWYWDYIYYIAAIIVYLYSLEMDDDIDDGDDLSGSKWRVHTCGIVFAQSFVLLFTALEFRAFVTYQYQPGEKYQPEFYPIYYTSIGLQSIAITFEIIRVVWNIFVAKIVITAALVSLGLFYIGIIIFILSTIGFTVATVIATVIYLIYAIFHCSLSSNPWFTPED